MNDEYAQPTENEYLKFVSDMQILMNSRGKVAFDAADEQTVLTLHSLTAHVLHLARTSAALHNSGDFVSSFVLARVALEHAVYAQLVAQHQSGYHGLAWLIVKGNGRAIKQAKAVLAVSAKILEAYEEIPILDKVPEFETFTSASAAFKESKFLMLMYGNLSQFVHPSNSLINTYLPSGYDSNDLSLVPIVNNTARAPHVLAFSTAISLGAYESILLKKGNLKAIDRAAKKLGLVSKLTLVLGD